MDLQPQAMENRFVRIEPIDEIHREGLRAACEADAVIWTELYPLSWAGEHFDPQWDGLTAERAAGRMIAFAVIVDGDVVGLTTFYAIDPVNAVVEIGSTYYRPDQRGGATNPAAKRLMMAAAFDAGARRVVYRVDALNARSRAAVLKLGAVEEALLRQDRITWTGRIRDTALFSILADEWPAVRRRLDARLAAFMA